MKTVERESVKQLGVAPLNSVNQGQTWRPLVRIGTRAGRANVVNSCDEWTGHWTSQHNSDTNVVNSFDSGLVTGLHIMTVT